MLATWGAVRLHIYNTFLARRMRASGGDGGKDGIGRGREERRGCRRERGVHLCTVWQRNVLVVAVLPSDDSAEPVQSLDKHLGHVARGTPILDGIF